MCIKEFEKYCNNRLYLLNGELFKPVGYIDQPAICLRSMTRPEITATVVIDSCQFHEMNCYSVDEKIINMLEVKKNG